MSETAPNVPAPLAPAPSASSVTGGDPAPAIVAPAVKLGETVHMVSERNKHAAGMIVGFRRNGTLNITAHVGNVNRLFQGCAYDPTGTVVGSWHHPDDKHLVAEGDADALDVPLAVVTPSQPTPPAAAPSAVRPARTRGRASTLEAAPE